MIDSVKKNISVVIPVYNEKENIAECIARVDAVLRGYEADFELICVDDGSTDGTFEVLSGLSMTNKRLKVVRFRKNYGQTAAMAAGFDLAKGDIVVTLDADLQNLPEDIPKLADSLGKKFDIACGWRKSRRDKLITRKIPSWIANKLISLVTGVKLHDYGCTLRAYKTNLVKEINLYGEMHRFLPALLGCAGANIVEIPVQHAPRLRGKSKYGIFRTFKVLLDLVTVKLLTSYSTKPIYFFGGLGFFLLALGFISFLIVAYRTVFLHILSSTPLIFIMVIFFISGVQMILTGLLAEINIRVFFESRGKPIYNIKDKINF